MSEGIEKLILNPVEFTPELPEISLEALGLTVAAEPGPDYGESSVTVERVRQDISEGVTDAHWTPVECTIPLIARGGVDLAIADPLHRLEGWVADVQRRKQGWVRRDFSTDGGFSGSVAAFVDSAALTPAQGWSFAHMQFAPGIALKFTRYPIWFATVEVTEDAEGNPLEAKGSAVRDLQLELADLLGTAPGLITVRLKNEGAEDWRGCYVSLECDDLGEGETALPAYEAKDLTPKGGAEVKTVSGAEVVKCPPLTAGWVTVLESLVGGTEHMTHVGPRRMIFRIDDVSTALNDVRWKLEWRTLGAAGWNQTMVTSTPLVVSSPVIGNYQLLDLGEARPEVPITGDPRFQWRLQAQSVSGSGKQPLIRDVYPMSTEQWARVADTSEAPIDGEPVNTPGKVNDATGVGTVVWSNPENAKAADLSSATAVLVAPASTVSHFLIATNFGFAIPAGATILGIAVDVLRAYDEVTSNGRVFDNRLSLVKAGAVQAPEKSLAAPWPMLPVDPEAWATYGGIGDLWNGPWLATDINATEFGVAISAKTDTVSGVGARARINAIQITIAYSEGANENRICFAGRSVKYTDLGASRQHVTDETWGDVPAPLGMLLKAPAPGQAGQDARLLVIPSVGDLATRPDSATVKAALTYGYHPGYLHAREAA